jgi:nucleoside triphosphate pyrophosphatase
MAEWGYQFTISPPNDSAERVPDSVNSLTPEQLVTTLAVQKARDVAARIDRGIIIGCDTVVECQGHILGKPADIDDARRMLTLLRGHEHRVFSGLCLWRRPDDLHRIEVDDTTLIMDPITDRELDDYLATGQWEGKAGAFGYQDGLDWVHVVAGSESNVVGLPMELLALTLQEFNLQR